jgi:hypothetical protein
MVRRRRLCKACGVRFTTYEIATQHSDVSYLHRVIALRGELDDLAKRPRVLIERIIHELARDDAARAPLENTAFTAK